MQKWNCGFKEPSWSTQICFWLFEFFQFWYLVICGLLVYGAFLNADLKANWRKTCKEWITERVSFCFSTTPRPFHVFQVFQETGLRIVGARSYHLAIKRVMLKAKPFPSIYPSEITSHSLHGSSNLPCLVECFWKYIWNSIIKYFKCQSDLEIYNNLSTTKCITL